MARTFATLAISVPLGTTWEETWQLLQAKNGPPVDLSGYTARMQLRPAITSASAALELTTANGRLTIDGPTGKVTVKVDPADLATLSPDNSKRRFLYDCELTSASNVVIPLFKGRVTVTPRVTR